MALSDTTGPGRRGAFSRDDVKITGLVTGAHFFSHLYILALPPLFPIMHQELGLSFTTLGLLLAALNLTTMIAQPPFGFAVDRFGAARILIAGHLLFATAIMLVGAWPVLPVMLALMVLAGLGNAVYHPADYSILATRIHPERMGRAFSIHTFGGYAGFAAAPVLMVTLASLMGWRWALAVAGMAGIAVGLVLIANRTSLGERVRDPAARPSADARSGGRLLSSPPVLLGLLFFLLLAIAHSAFTSFGVIVLQKIHGLDLTGASLPISLYLFMSAAGVLAGGMIADRFGRHALVIACCSALMGAGAAMIAGLDSGYLALLAIFTVMGLASGVIAPARDMLVRAATPPGASGKVFGFVMIGFNIGGLLGPPLFGHLVDQGRPELVFWVAAIASVLVIATAFSARRAAGTGKL